MATARRILTIVGARPQFVKAAVVSRAIARHNQAAAGCPIEEIILHTGQHYDPAMSQAFFDEMEIPAPAANLGVGSGRHGETTGAMLVGIEREILARKPDRVLVYGDTNSPLAGALAAVKLQVPVAHVEAGLRSFNRRMPEEINRIVTDRLSDLLFCPSARSRRWLEAEGISQGVHEVGDVMADAVLHYRNRAILPAIQGSFALATLHRAENTDDLARLKGILAALADCPVPVVLPLHPRTRKAMERERLAAAGFLRLCEPLSYFSLLGHLERCAFVVTDSGGLQKEAFFFGKRCITVRDETEWVELVDCGANRLVGAGQERIREAFAWARDPLPLATRAVYGRGDAAERIVALLVGAARA